VHPREPGQVAHRLMPNAEYHEVPTEDRPDQDVALEDWNAKEGLSRQSSSIFCAAPNASANQKNAGRNPLTAYHRDRAG
jgi:hypothetical protein